MRWKSNLKYIGCIIVYNLFYKLVLMFGKSYKIYKVLENYKFIMKIFRVLKELKN